MLLSFIETARISASSDSLKKNRVLDRWLSVVPASTTPQRRPGLDVVIAHWTTVSLSTARDCPGVSAGVSACYTVPASYRHVLDKAVTNAGNNLVALCIAIW